MSSRPPEPRRWVVCQLGARMHYAVPRLLEEAGQLDRFYTDVYAGPRWARLLAGLPDRWRLPGLRRLMGRVATHLPQDKIWSHTIFGLAYYMRRSTTRDLEKMSAVHLWAGRVFGNHVVKSGFGNATAVYTFNTAALEILRAARSQGLYTVVEQTIAPRSVEEDLLAEEQTRYPGWEQTRRRGPYAELTAKREFMEWELADVIVCGSEFVREGIARCGGPVERCVVVPYGVDAQFGASPRVPHAGPLRVLTIGEVGLRKGAPYCLETASTLGTSAEFRWVGPTSLSTSALKDLSTGINLTGTVPRTRIVSHYDWADVFFLPSVCEGSATVTYEASACGLPVITTPNAGSTVRDGETGYVVPVRDVSAMADRLLHLHRDRDLLARMSSAATAHAREVSLSAYQERLLHLLGTSGISSRAPSPVPAQDVESPSWICCQVGAREHYSVPRALHRHDSLITLITEAWIKPGRHLGRLHPRLEQRFHPDLSDLPVRSFNIRALFFETWLRLAVHRPWKRVKKRNTFFQNCALSVLKPMKPAAPPPILFAYSYAALDMLRFAKSQGWAAVLGQIDPGAPGTPPPEWDEPSAPPEYWARWRLECAEADAIVVNSEWSRECLIREGIPKSKLHLIPLAYESHAERVALPKKYPVAFTEHRPLRIALLGKLNRRKGLAEVFDAIRLLQGEPVSFHFTGDREIPVPPDLRRDPRLVWQGSISRHAVDDCYRDADVFLFPSHSDGFGLTQLEAQSWKVPVIASRHCGTVVHHEKNGLLLPEVSGRAIADALLQCLRSPESLASWSKASGVSSEFSLNTIGRQFLELGAAISAARENPSPLAVPSA